MENKVKPWEQALERLEQGNERFVSGLRSADAMVGHIKLRSLAQNGQKPYAIVLSCSDSRVPAELLFDCGFGDLFVIRVAGNVVQPSQVASIEYAAKVLGASLCVVMGHSKCGAVQAALDTEQGKAPNLGPNIGFLIDLILPAVKKVVVENASASGNVLDKCVKENVRCTAKEIISNSTLLENLRDEGQFRVVEAVFNLETGRVEFEAIESQENKRDLHLKEKLSSAVFI